MATEKESKIGILKYIAQTGAKGCKFEDEPDTWFNPATDEAKEMIDEEYIGKEVEIMLVKGEKTKFASMVLLDTSKEKEESDGPEESEEEKVPQTPPKEEETNSVEPQVSGPLTDLASATKILSSLETKKYTSETFEEMAKTELETAKKGSLKLTYASWAEAWGALKKIHPTAEYHVHTDEKTGMPFINDEKLGAFVKVSVKILGLSHTVYLPVMNNKNQAAKGTELDVVLINKNIQRALVKAIAYHGLGLYVFKGKEFEDE